MDNYRRKSASPTGHGRRSPRNIDGFVSSVSRVKSVRPPQEASQTSAATPMARLRPRTAQPALQRPRPKAAPIDGMALRSRLRSPDSQSVQIPSESQEYTEDVADIDVARQPVTATARPPRFSFKKEARQARKQWRQQKRAARPAWKKWLMRFAILCTVAVLVIAGLLVFKGYTKLRNIFGGGGYSAALDGDINKLKGEGDGRINILMVGGRGEDDPDGGGLTDTILVMSIDPVNNKSALLSIPRDLWVSTDYGTTKINALFKFALHSAMENNGGDHRKATDAAAKELQETLTTVLGINLHYYATIDIDGFLKAVDTLGGVRIQVPEDLYDRSMAWENGGNPLLVPAGNQTLNGKQALFYVQSRKGSSRGDFDRSERQRILISAVMRQVLSVGTYSNPATISRLMDDFGNHLQTNFSMNEILRLYDLISKVGDPQSVELVSEENRLLTTANIGGLSVVVPVSGTFEYDAVHQYIRSVLPDGHIIKENVPIAVLNTTTREGYGSEQAEKLKSYGYNVVSVGNAPAEGLSGTTIVDLTSGDSGKYTRHYLVNRLSGVTVTTQLPDGVDAGAASTGFVILLR